MFQDTQLVASARWRILLSRTFSRQFLFFLASLRSGEDPGGEVKEHRHARSAREIFGDFLLMVRLIQQVCLVTIIGKIKNKRSHSQD